MYIKSSAFFFLASMLSNQFSSYDPELITHKSEGTSDLDSRESLWWQKGVIYQVYLRSFKDSNNDGIGDLQGLISKLSYLKGLGVDALWLTPVHSSPNYDFGYDVANFYDVNPEFGSLRDFHELLDKADELNIRIMMDLVVNHTSDQHPWFVESRSSKESPKRDWYIWADGKGKNPPNNWRSRLDESAWVYDKKTDQYYQHSFFKEQPDLNWRNPEVQLEVEKIMRFWLDKGVAGFRLDLANYYLKDSQLRDNPTAVSLTKKMTGLVYKYHKQQHLYDKDSPELISIYRKMRKIADEYDAVLLGEIDIDDDHAKHSTAALGLQSDGLHLAFNFAFLESDFRSRELSQIIDEWAQILPKDNWPVYSLSNHDKKRHASKHDSPEKNRLAALLLLTLKGTPVLYYGEEIGMEEVWYDQQRMKDPLARVMKLHSIFKQIGRDGCRTPMQWNKEKHAGFSEEKPWLDVATSYQTTNVEEQEENPDSLLNLYKRLLSLRKIHPAFQSGEQTLLQTKNHDLLLYTRTLGDQVFYIVLNTGNREISLDHTLNFPKVILTTKAFPPKKNVVRPYEGIIWQY